MLDLGSRERQGRRTRTHGPPTLSFVNPDTKQTQTSSLADGALLVRRRDHLVEVVFNRPERHNAFTSGTYEGLLEICAELRHDEDVRMVVFRGAGGRAFAAGNEISEFTSLSGGSDGVAYEARVGRVLRGIAELPQVTVAAVEGVCVGGGLAVATHCDLRIATDGSRFGYPIARTLGNALSAFIVYRCATLFGESLTREMLLASRLVDAERAYNVGAVMAVVVFAAGWVFVSLNSHGWESNRLLCIGVGGGIGWFMMFNVWGLIWRMQKRMIGWMEQNALNGTPLPEKAADFARLTFLASRVNFWLSFPMLFFMGAASHYPRFGSG